MARQREDQSTLDSLADAETLRLAHERHYFGGALKRTSLYRAYHNTARCHISLSVREARFGATGRPDETWAYHEARSAAHAAFLAVPGLRGE